MHTSKRLAFSPIYYVFFFLLRQFFWQPIREGNFIIQPKVDFDISASTVAGLLKLGLLPLSLPRLPSLSLYALIICSLFSFQIPSGSIHRSLGLDLSGRKGYCFLDMYQLLVLHYNLILLHLILILKFRYLQRQTISMEYPAHTYKLKALTRKQSLPQLQCYIQMGHIPQRYYFFFCNLKNDFLLYCYVSLIIVICASTDLKKLVICANALNQYLHIKKDFYNISFQSYLQIILENLSEIEKNSAGMHNQQAARLRELVKFIQSQVIHRLYIFICTSKTLNPLLMFGYVFNFNLRTTFFFLLICF